MAWSIESGSSVSSARSAVSESAQSNHDTEPTEMNEPYSPVKIRRPGTYSASPEKSKFRDSNGTIHSAGARLDIDAGESPRRQKWKQPLSQSFDGGTDSITEPKASAVYRRRRTASPKQLNRLLIALVRSPCLQYHVRRQWWDEEILGARTRANDLDHATPSQIRRASVVDDHALDMIDDCLSTEKRDCSNADRVAILDAHIDGTPVRYTTPDFHDVGHCVFAEVSYGASASARLHIDSPMPGKGAINTVTIQVTARIIERRTGRRAAALASETDVTEAMARAALTELDACNDFHHPNTSSIHISNNNHNSSSENYSNQISDSQIDAAISRIANLTPETCTMQTLILMSALERARRRYARFAVVHTDSATHDSGVPKSGCIRWTSASHYCPRIWREGLVELISRRAPLAAPFIARVPAEWTVQHIVDDKANLSSQDNEGSGGGGGGGLTDMAVQCVPLFGSASSESPAVWVCFMRSAADSIPV